MTTQRLDICDTMIEDSWNDLDFMAVLNEISATAGVTLDDEAKSNFMYYSGQRNDQFQYCNQMGDEHSPSSGSWSPTSNQSSEQQCSAELLDFKLDCDENFGISVPEVSYDEPVESVEVVDDILFKAEELPGVMREQILNGSNFESFCEETILHPVCKDFEIGVSNSDTSQVVHESAPNNNCSDEIKTVAIDDQPCAEGFVTLPSLIYPQGEYQQTLKRVERVHSTNIHSQPVVYVMAPVQNGSLAMQKHSTYQSSTVPVTRHKILSHPYLRPIETTNGQQVTILNKREPRSAYIAKTTEHSQDAVATVKSLQSSQRREVVQSTSRSGGSINTNYVVEKVVRDAMKISPAVQLTEEERSLFDAEGLPIPFRYPLSKQEEKNLKRVRRKLKNKWSAQESRRKRKEYMETLEDQCKSVCTENETLKKRVSDLEHDNRTLVSQLRKLQELVTSFGSATFKSSLAGVSGLYHSNTPNNNPSSNTTISPPTHCQGQRLNTTATLQRDSRASNGKSTVLMMFTIFLTSLMAGTSPYGSSSSILFGPQNIFHDPPVTSTVSHLSARSQNNVNYAGDDDESSATRSLRSSLLLLSPFPPTRVIYTDRSPFRPIHEDIKSRVIFNSNDELKSEPNAPSGRQHRLVRSKYAGVQKLAKATIPVGFKDVQQWNDVDIERSRLLHGSLNDSNWFVMAATYSSSVSNRDYATDAPRVVINGSQPEKEKREDHKCWLDLNYNELPITQNKSEIVA